MTKTFKLSILLFLSTNLVACMSVQPEAKVVKTTKYRKVLYGQGVAPEDRAQKVVAPVSTQTARQRAHDKSTLDLAGDTNAVTMTKPTPAKSHVYVNGRPLGAASLDRGIAGRRSQNLNRQRQGSSQGALRFRRTGTQYDPKTCQFVPNYELESDGKSDEAQQRRRELLARDQRQVDVEAAPRPRPESRPEPPKVIDLGGY